MFPFDTIVNSPTILFNHKAVRESESILKCAQALRPFSSAYFVFSIHEF